MNAPSATAALDPAPKRKLEKCFQKIHLEPIAKKLDLTSANLNKYMIKSSNKFG